MHINKKHFWIIVIVIVFIISTWLLLKPTTRTTKEVFAQAQIGEITRLWFPKRIPVSDGFVYKYKLHVKYDTAMIYLTGPDTFEVTSTFRKYKKAPPPPDLISSVDDNVVTVAQVYNPPYNAGNNVSIANGWSHIKDQTWNANHFAKSASYVDAIPEAYVEVTCSPCYKFEWWTEKRVNHGIAAVSIDGGAPVDIDLYDVRTDNNSLLVFTSAALSNSTHKIRVAYTGRKNYNASQTNIIHDKFVTYTKQ